MSPTCALVLAFGPDPDAPPRRWFAVVAAPGLALMLAGLGWLMRHGDDGLAEFGEDD